MTWRLIPLAADAAGAALAGAPAAAKERAWPRPSFPGLTFCVPSAMTCSPGLRPAAISHSLPMRSPTSTGRMSNLVVGADDGEQNLPCISVTRPLRHQQGALTTFMVVRMRPNWPGRSRIIGVGEQRGDLESAGRDVGLAVEHGDLPELRIGRARRPGRGRAPRRLASCRRRAAFATLRVFLFADAEIDPIGRPKTPWSARRCSRLQQVADLRLGDASDASDRRGDPGESEVELRRLQVGVGGLQFRLGRLEGAGRVVEILLADGVLLWPAA